MTDTAAFTELCPGCFADKGNANLCPHCGYDESLKRGPLVLAHRTLLHHGQYLIGRVLGKPGGFGITYLALDTRLATRVAIKEYLPRDLAGRDAGHATISAHSAEDGEFFRYGLTQFLQEARTLAQFDHANIVRVRNFFEENGTGYLVMDYYDGVTLADYLAQQPQGRLPEKTAVGILMPILDGLREVHAKNFLHRDIKPQNIYLTTGNRPILLDFGAARQAMSERSRSLSVVLSEGYAPYEQYHRRGEQGPWTDIYACAAVLYHAIAGEAPPPATERMHKDELDIAALGVSMALAEALRLGLATDHHNRPQRMTEFQALLLGGGDAGASEKREQKPKNLDLPTPSKIVVTRPVEPTQKEITFGLSLGWAPALAAIIVLAVVAVGTREEKKTVPPTDVAAPVTVPSAPTIASPAPTTVRDDPETNSWNEAKVSGERKRLDAYFKQYPKGKFADLADIELKKLDQREAVARDSAEAEKQQAAEQQIWEQAKARNTSDAYANYLNNYPKGRYAVPAVEEQKKIFGREQGAKEAAAIAKIGVLLARSLSRSIMDMKTEDLDREASQLLTRRDAEAVGWLRKAADRENAMAQFALGVMHFKGVGVTINSAEAMRMVRKAADQGNADGQVLLGILFGTNDKVEAVRWYRKAAEQENELAQILLGMAYDKGDGVAKDGAEAVRWYRKAADQGNALAQTLLAVKYITGEGVGKDFAEVARWMQKAAEQGYKEAQYALGYIYLNGHGVTKDEGEAIRWWQKASAQGDAKAKAELQKRGLQ